MSRLEFDFIYKNIVHGVNMRYPNLSSSRQKVQIEEDDELLQFNFEVELNEKKELLITVKVQEGKKVGRRGINWVQVPQPIIKENVGTEVKSINYGVVPTKVEGRSFK